MKLNQRINRKSAIVMPALVGLLFLGGCAEGYDEDAGFESSVRNTTLSSVNADKITLEASADGASWTITWPVVHGAGGYEVRLYDVGNPDDIKLVSSQTVDGCSTTAKREDDVNYRLVVKVLGNTALNNTAPADSCVKEFTTFTETFAAIPAVNADGTPTDLAAWFAAHPIPADSAGINLNYDLVAGADYVLSGDLDFEGASVTLRSTSKDTHAHIAFTGNYSIQSYAALTVKYINFDCSKSLAPVFELSPTPADSLTGLSGKGDYINVMHNWTMKSCRFDGVNYQLMYDNNLKYCLETTMIDDCVFHLTSSTETNIDGNALFYYKNGFCNYTYVQNSTFYNTGDANPKYFLQHGNNNRADRAGYVYNLVSYVNNAFYKLNASQWSNYSGFAGRSTSRWTCTGNIFYDCGPQVARRILGGRDAESYLKQSGYSADYFVFNNNTYWNEGAAEEAGTYDNGTCLGTDPAFVAPDADTPNFLPTGEDQVKRKTGDPRWYN